MLELVAGQSWHPAAQAVDGHFYLVPILVGTAVTALGAILIATPLGICSAAYLQFYASPRFANWFRRLIELMAGIPSVVYGLWGLVSLVPLVAKIYPPGQSVLTGVVILALMILPTVTLLADAAFGAVPRDYLRGAAALGLSRSSILLNVALPAARSGLVAAVILALVRALGETMAVVMVCGNVVRFPHSLFDPVRTLTATIALEMGYARNDHRSVLFLCGTILLMFVAALIAIAELTRRRKLHGST